MLPRPLEFGEDFINPEAAAGILNRFLEYPEANLRENCWELLSGRLGRELLMFTQEVIRFLCVKRTRESRVRSVLYMVLCAEPTRGLGRTACTRIVPLVPVAGGELLVPGALHPGNGITGKVGSGIGPDMARWWGFSWMWKRLGSRWKHKKQSIYCELFHETNSITTRNLKNCITD